MPLISRGTGVCACVLDVLLRRRQSRNMKLQGRDASERNATQVAFVIGGSSVCGGGILVDGGFQRTFRVGTCQRFSQHNLSIGEARWHRPPNLCLCRSLWSFVWELRAQGGGPAQHMSNASTPSCEQLNQVFTVRFDKPWACLAQGQANLAFVVFC